MCDKKGGSGDGVAPGVDVCGLCQNKPQIVKPLPLPKLTEAQAKAIKAQLQPVGDTCSCGNSIVQPAQVPRTCGCQVCLAKVQKNKKSSLSLPSLQKFELPKFELPKFELPKLNLVDKLKEHICSKLEKKEEEIEDKKENNEYEIIHCETWDCPDCKNNGKGNGNGKNGGGNHIPQCQCDSSVLT